MKDGGESTTTKKKNMFSGSFIVKERRHIVANGGCIIRKSGFPLR